MAQAPVKATTTATTLTVNWNWRNLLIESYTFLPHITAFTMLVKLSSVRMMSEASLATSVPAIPIAKPTSAFLRAGASLVPSPVTATTSLPAESVLSMIPGMILSIQFQIIIAWREFLICSVHRPYRF